MLKNIINLTKVFITTSFNKTSTNKKRNSIIRILLYLFIFIYVIGAFGFLSYQILSGLISINQEKAFVAYILMAIITIVMFTTIMTIINVFYFSNDNLSILPLPFKPIEVLSSKFNTLLVYVYMEEAMFGLIPLFMYGYFTKQSIIYYILTIFVLLLIPIIPLLIVSFIVIIIMAITKGIRNKNLVQVITMVVAIILTLFISMYSSSMSSQEDIMILMEKAQGLVEIYKKAFITMPLAIDTLMDYNVVSLLLLAIISIFAYILVCIFAQKLYYRGMLGSLYSSSGISDKKITDSSYKSKGLWLSYVIKEFKVYFRRPTLFVQLILPCLLLPAFTLGVTYYGVVSESGPQTINLLKIFYNNKDSETYVLAIFLIACMFTLMYSMISLVAISKDGHDAYFMKYIPVPFYKQIIYKMTPDFLVNIFCYLVIAIMSYILFKLPIRFILMSIPVMFLYSILHAFLILSDVRKPKLEWINETQVTKRNLRTMLGFLLSLVNMSIVALLVFVLKTNALLTTSILTSLYLIIDIYLYIYIKKKDIVLAENFN